MGNITTDKTKSKNIMSKPINRIITGQYPTVGMRHAKVVDIPALETLIAQCFQKAAEGHYTPRQIESALASIARVDSKLIEEGRVHVATSGREIVGVGGWSGRKARYPGDVEATAAKEKVDPATTPAHLRSFYINAYWRRMGIGRMLVDDCLTSAKQQGFRQMEVLSTPMSLAFFTALGFEAQGEMEIILPDGVSLPMTRLTMTLT